MATMLLRKIAAGAQSGLKPGKLNDNILETNGPNPISRPERVESGGRSGGWLSGVKLDKIDDAFRTVTVNPLIRSLMLGGVLAGGTYLAGPMIGRLSRSVFGAPQQYDEYGRPVDITQKDRWWLTGIAGGLGALGSAALSLDRRRPFWGLMSYSPKKTAYYSNQPAQQTAQNNMGDNPMQRTASAGFYGPNDTIPLNMAKEGILGNPNLNLEMKSRALDVLNSFPNQNQSVNSNDIINKAVNTGISGLTGYAVGYLTSSALGLGDPKQYGKSIGIMSALKSALF